MLHGSNIEGTLRGHLWAEAALTATELDQILVKYGKPKNSFEKVFGPKANGIVLQPRVFGEMVVVMDRTGMKSKLADREKECVLVGYAAVHAAGTHRVLRIFFKTFGPTFFQGQ